MVQFDSMETTTTGYMQYVNKESGRISQLDPRLDAVMERVSKELNCIRYTTYRVAAKLSMLSVSMFMDLIPYQTVIGVLQRHSLHHTDSAPLVRPDQLTSLLHDIFYAADKASLFDGRPEFELEHSVGMISNLLWNIFDRNRSTPLSALELKLTFLMICKPTSYDRIIFEHFLLAADHNACVSRYRFESLVRVMAKIFAHIDPIPISITTSTSGRPFFVQNITPLLDDCFAQCPGLVGLNKFQFYTLWRRPPTGLVSFGHFANVQALIGRMSIARNIEHARRTCVGCTITTRGLSFRCQQCRKITLCFRCFGTGYSAGRHVPGHRMYELGSDMDEPEQINGIRSFVKKLCHLFTGKPFAQNEESSLREQNITMETNVIDIDECETRPMSSLESTAENHRNTLADVSPPQEKSNSGISLSPRGHSTMNSSDRAFTNDFGTLPPIVEALARQNDLLADWLNAQSTPSCDFTFLYDLRTTLQSLVDQLQSLHHTSRAIPTRISSSTPYRRPHNNNLVEFGSLMTNTMLSTSSEAAKSIKGNEINRSYLEANRSDLSIGDLSTWLHTRRTADSMRAKRESLPTLTEDENKTEMSAFKGLLNAMKEILDDSYSDNAELTKVTTQLESVLGHIIDDAASRRSTRQSIDTYV